MKTITTLVITTLALAAQTALAQPADSFKSAVQRALTTSPEVTAKLNALRASTSEVEVARGGYYPKLDLSAEVGRVNDRISSRTPESQSMNHGGVALTATQMLWDGLSTRSEVSRLDHARLVRYFEFLDTSEQTALETVKAYLDVQRTTQLVKLAEDNYVSHRQVHDQMLSRVKAGVGRGVDLEQAAARMALAESNLTAETANLHDVTERYRRLVGALPEVSPNTPNVFDKGLPASSAALLDLSAKRNAGVAAAVENLRAAQAQAKQRDSAFHPRVEARIRSGVGHNFDAVADQKRDTAAGLSLNWNLFNGGSDKARVRQAASLLDQAGDLRDKACRDTRQTAAIAFNDVRKLTDQVRYLDQNTLSSEKTARAYRQQFDIGQRSLLDVLNAENELYSARRSLSNAEYDLVLAKARTHAASSNLVNALGLTRAGGASDDALGGQSWEAGDDASSRCPLTPTELRVTGKDELDQRARSAGARSAATPAPVAALAPAKSTAAAAPSDASLASTPISARLLDWSKAWNSKDVTQYVSFYDSKFKPETGTRSAWFNARSKMIRAKGASNVQLANVQRRTLPNGQVETTFDQTTTAAGTSSTVQKTLTWSRRGVEWYIVKEASR